MTRIACRLSAAFWVAILSVFFGLAVYAPVARAQSVDHHHFDISAGDLGQALTLLGLQAEREIVFPADITRGKRSNAVRGDLTLKEALDKLLSGSGLTYRLAPSGQVIVQGATAPLSENIPSVGASDDDPAKLQEIVVTGSHIRGAPSSSPVVVLTQQQILDAGQNNLGEALRSITENFNGGQNPGVAAGALGINNQNINSASAANLRGLGPDATLTLINGRRLSYDGFGQGVDLTAIPVSAIDRVEVITDGASAIYGSDAVAGVVNVILKRDYDGISATARGGYATDGGDGQQQYTLAGGKTWGSGGFIATYSYDQNRPIYSSQRSFTSSVNAPATLLGESKQINWLISGHQDLTSFAHFSVDALYTTRDSSTVSSFPGISFYNLNRNLESAISPTLTIDLPHRWELTLNGVIASDKTLEQQPSYSSGVLQSTDSGCFCNYSKTGEVDLEGPLFRLPAGETRLALGGGYRSSELTTSFGAPVDYKRDDHYAFGEIYIPVVSRSQGITGISSASVNAALRYEDYPGIESVVTPKIGVIYAPTLDVDLKGTWGKSFKAPTLEQSFGGPFAYLDSASNYGYGGSANSTVLVSQGSNPELTPERATTWTASFVVHPTVIPGLRVEATYFHIMYSERVVSPITNLAVALADPAYASFITSNPSVPQQQQFIGAANAAGQFYNFTSGSYDPASVVALVNDNYANVESQTIHGVDLQGVYRADLGSVGFLTPSLNASWLIGSQQISSGQPAIPISGVVYTPAHFRARAGLTWEYRPWMVNAFVNYIGGVLDTVASPSIFRASQTTTDLNVKYSLGDDLPVVRNVSILFSIQNLFNVNPPDVQPGAPGGVPYDSTNYSSIGRFIGLSVTKRW
jgi:outer membrane receptor protein involved in Fe transport